jgi:FkbM family methyltransferase
MMLPLGELLKKYKVNIKGVTHVGSHWAEEHEAYLQMGIKKFVYIEPCKEAFEKMWEKLALNIHRSHRSSGVIEAMDEYKQRALIGNDSTIQMFPVGCGSVEGRLVMYVSHQNQGQSNSLYAPNLHLQQHPEVVFDDAEIINVTLLDKLPIEKEECNLLVMDCQGYEGEVIKGAAETLNFIDAIYTEVNRGQTYAGNMEIEEMDELLSDFTRVETYWPSPNWTWGDALYIRKTLL